MNCPPLLKSWMHDATPPKNAIGTSTHATKRAPSCAARNETHRTGVSAAGRRDCDAAGAAYWETVTTREALEESRAPSQGPYAQRGGRGSIGSAAPARAHAQTGARILLHQRSVSPEGRPARPARAGSNSEPTSEHTRKRPGGKRQPEASTDLVAREARRPHPGHHGHASKAADLQHLRPACELASPRNLR